MPVSTECAAALLSFRLDSNHKRDSGFVEPYSGFQSSGFHITQRKFPRFRIHYAYISQIPESAFPFRGAKRCSSRGGGGVDRELIPPSWIPDARLILSLPSASSHNACFSCYRPRLPFDALKCILSLEQKVRPPAENNLPLLTNEIFKRR